MKIGFVTVFDSADPQSWSGLNYGIRTAISEAGADVVPIDNLRHGRSISRVLSKLVSKYFYKKSHDHYWSVQTARAYSYDVSARLRSESVDFIVSTSNMPVSYAQTNIPITVWGDAVFDSLLDFYPQFSSERLSRLSIREGSLIDLSSVSRVNHWSMSSRWAANSVSSLNVPRRNIAVLPYGANLNVNDELGECKYVRKLIHDKVNMVWVGVDWYRKRGQFAIDILNAVRKNAPESTLTVIGCKVPDELQSEYIHNIPYINKCMDVDCKTYLDVLYSSHVMLIPSLADCCAVVGVEACKTGLPCLVCDVGGQSDIVPRIHNNFVLSMDAAVSDWAKVIHGLCASQIEYEHVQANFRDHYNDWFDWRLNSRKLLSLLAELR
jgi:glycosyltransferase involved in cell wall biosynthesis